MIDIIFYLILRKQSVILYNVSLMIDIIFYLILRTQSVILYNVSLMIDIISKILCYLFSVVSCIYISRWTNHWGNKNKCNPLSQCDGLTPNELMRSWWYETNNHQNPLGKIGPLLTICRWSYHRLRQSTTQGNNGPREKLHQFADKGQSHLRRKLRRQ